MQKKKQSVGLSELLDFFLSTVLLSTWDHSWGVAAELDTITFEAESCRRGLEQALLGRFRWDAADQQTDLPARFWSSLLQPKGTGQK